MTLLIQAHPEQEYRRLQKTILEMPISNPDKIERFPKGIPRQLFPQYEDSRIRKHLKRTIAHYADIQLPWNLNQEEPPSHGGALFHKSSLGQQICNPQKSGRRSVSFVLPPDPHPDAPQHFKEATEENAENVRRQTDEAIPSYGGKPRQRECAGSNNKRHPRNIHRSQYMVDADDFRIR